MSSANGDSLLDGEDQCEKKVTVSLLESAEILHSFRPPLTLPARPGPLRRSHLPAQGGS